MSGLYDQAVQMAKSGAGWEDIWVRLRKDGLSRREARIAVFGKLIAGKMEQREREAS